MIPLRRLLSVLFSLILLLPATAQTKGQYLIPIADKIERAAVKDDDGKLQWAPFTAGKCVNCKGRQVMECLHCARMEGGEEANCIECKGTREATCRVCGGSGETWDILTRAPCPTCFGAAFTPCTVCRGVGSFPVAGGGSKPQKCGCCGGVGGYPCATCKGERWVEPPKMRPSVAEADLDDLNKAKAALDEVAEAVAGFATTGDARKDAKAYAAMVKPGERWFPPLKLAQRHFDATAKKLAKGAVWTAYREMLHGNVETAKSALTYWVQYNQRLLALCIARQQANAGGGKDE